jgi:heptosyltransferase-2
MKIIEYIIVKLFYESLRRLPFRFSHFLVTILRIIAQHIFGYRKKVVLTNLKYTFPDIDEEAMKSLVSGVYKNFFQLWIEMLQTWRLDEGFIKKNFKIHNWDIVEQAIEEKRGLILVTGHPGNYEWAVHYCILQWKNVHEIMKRLKNKRINDLVVSIRELTGGKVIYKKSALRNGLKALKGEQAVAIVTDQYAGSQGILVDFLGKPASTATGTAIFHLKTGAPMVFVTGIRQKLGEMDIYFERIPDSKKMIVSEETIRNITQSHTFILEKWIRKYPAQYFWTHRRWKSESKKILIIQTAFIGDVILTTPLIEALVHEYPDVEIDFLTIPKSKALLESNPNIRNLILFDKRGNDRGLKGLICIGNLLKNNQYDLCITPHRSLRSAFLTWKTKSNFRIGFNRSAWKGAFTHIINYDSSHHEIARNLSLLSAIGLKKQKTLPVLYSTHEDKENVDSYLSNSNINNKSELFAIAPGSVWPTKRWPEEYYKEFCRLVAEKGINVILVGGPEDQDLCKRIADETNHVLITAGQLNLRETYYLLTLCSGILTNDSAPLHLGMAANIWVFALFGPTVPEFGFAPFGKKSMLLENRNLVCRPCAIHGSKKCPIKTFDCMETIHPKQVAQQVIETLLNKNN